MNAKISDITVTVTMNFEESKLPARNRYFKTMIMIAPIIAVIKIIRGKKSMINKLIPYLTKSSQ